VSTLVVSAAVAKTWLATLGMLAFQGTLLAIVAFAMTRAGRLRPAWQSAIWLVVTIKLALPWGPAMPWSLSDLIASMSSTEAAPPPFVVTSDLVRVAREPVSIWPALGWLALAALWTVGAVFVLVRAITAQVSTSRAAHRAVSAPAASQQLLATLAATMRVRTPRLALGAADVGPHVVGLLRTTIVVPPTLLDDEPLLRAALLHELAHVRRRDAIARLVQIVAGAMMWWLPVMRFVQKRLELARVAACDAWALETGEVARPAYARLLVRMARLRTAAAPALAAHHSLDARVAAVLGTPVRPRMTHLHRLVIAGFAVLALGGARRSVAEARGESCRYTPKMAEALFLAFPTADLDGDGLLSRDEACGLQAELRRLPEEERLSRLTPEAEAKLQTLLPEPLYCGTPPGAASLEVPSCQKDEGVDR
jgi:beta-lactamase regulating signal transducer with metallopeptidase domain